MQAPANSPAAHLNEELQAAHALLALIKQEQAYLVAADVAGLSALSEEKSRLVSRLTELALQRHRQLGNAGFEAAESGMAEWIKSSAATAEMNHAWNRLLQVVAESKHLNHTNGLLIGQHMARNQSALDILTGTQRSEAVYGPDGQAATRLPSRGFVAG
jgi:flagella synthesis protein FlgN